MTGGGSFLGFREVEDHPGVVLSFLDGSGTRLQLKGIWVFGLEWK